MIVSEAAGLLGNPEGERKYANLANRIKKAFNQRFFHPETGLYDNGSQTAQSCALFQGLVDDEHKERVFQELLRAIEKRDFHIDTGILGSKYVLNVLLDHGRPDVALKMASKKTLPSWGWMIEQGATTLWEQWRGSDSRNHIMFGDVSAWFLKALAGIRSTKPGFTEFVIRPCIVGELTEVHGEYDSISGRIISDWKLKGGKILHSITVPPNTKAMVYVPTSNPEGMTESGNPVKSVKEIKWVRQEKEAAVFEVSSGSYTFEAVWNYTGVRSF